MLRHISLASLILACTVIAVGQNNSAAWKRWQHLQHGVAASGWFSESGNYSIQQLRAFTTPADIEHIQKLGFDHIRIPVDPIIFQCDGDWNACERIRFLDQVNQKALTVNLYVILGFHPNPQCTHQLITSGPASEKYLRLWSQIADHYGKMDSDRIILEVMNRFGLPDLNSWFGSPTIYRHYSPQRAKLNDHSAGSWVR